ncbi:MAG: hypothetical protein IPH36_19600 [Saprospiraceae bacterium]|nr:hypothetical protein [Saprospiraceae bacterium]
METILVLLQPNTSFFAVAGLKYYWLFLSYHLPNIYKYRLIPAQMGKSELSRFHHHHFDRSRRYLIFWFEGMMHIREGETANSRVFTEQYLQFRVIKNGNRFLGELVYFSSLATMPFQSHIK